MSRRAALATGVLALLLAACAPLTMQTGAAAAAGPLLPATDRLIDLRSGRDTTATALLAEVRSADWVLLGELHDNPHHHARRASLLRALQGSPAALVAEHLTQGQRLAAGPAPLLARLQAAGFEPRAWAWPVHQTLFAAADEAGLPLWGGNLPAALARQIAREGPGAWPPASAALLAAAPLAGPAQALLDDDLLASHCGHLPPSRLPAMRSAQRARDAAMWQALRAARSAGATAAQPVILLAGNGHVRMDYGVGQLGHAAAPGQRGISVGFGETGDAPQGPYTHLWLTPPAQRGDPCAGLNPAALQPPPAGPTGGR